MAMKVDNHWPLVVANPLKENAIQTASVSNFHSQKIKEPIVLENLSDRGVGTLWEKGTFVDIYI